MDSIRLVVGTISLTYFALTPDHQTARSVLQVHPAIPGTSTLRKAPRFARNARQWPDTAPSIAGKAPS